MERETVWVSSATLGWVLGTVSSVSGDYVIVQTENGETIKTIKKEVLVYQEHHKADIDDMIALPEAHEATILYNLNQRFQKDKIYTYIGPVIISVNPFKDVKNTSDSILNQYLAQSVEHLPPHLYAIAHSAYNSLITRGESQSIIISGESGAGKTEATKVILKYLTVACGRSSGPRHTQELSQRILATNPVLEAFGNAKTVKNNNSSRFGKFISIAFDPGGSLNSASISNYLLETIRVVTQAPTERNYHVFYQLLYGSSQQERSLYKLKSDASQYKYLKNGNVMVDGMDDKEGFIKLKQSLSTLGVIESEQQNIFMLLSGILHLGNIDFVGQDTVKIMDLVQLKIICSLFQVPEDLMIPALTLRMFIGGSNRQTAYNIPLNYSQAIENRDALAKSLYSQLFDYLVKRINRPLLGDNPPLDLNNDHRKFIGVLDIYGFEVFQTNSMEQFCINYANEKLHALFNQHMFKAEQALYTKEGVPWETIKFVDNQDCIDLIEGFGGVLSMLDEEGKIPRGADKSLLEKLSRKHGRHPRFKYNPRFPLLFGIDHYAGSVEYDVQGFLLKNKDTLNKDLSQVMWSSDSTFMQNLFADDEPVNKSRNQDKGATNRSKLTVCGIFQKSLTSLVQILSSSVRHYIRCIKPNDNQQSNLFNPLKVLQQLKSNGIFETIRMRKAGYASHIAMDVFFKRFNFLGIRSETKDSIGGFLRGFFPDTSQWIIGATKVFLKEKVSDRLESLRREIYIKAIITVQAHVRSYHQKQMIEVLLKERRERHLRAVVNFQKYIRRWNARRRLLLLLEIYRRDRALLIFQRYIRAYNAKIKLISLIIEKREMLRRQREERERQERLERERQERERQERERQERQERERERRIKEDAARAEKLAREEAHKKHQEAEKLAREEAHKKHQEAEKLTREEAARKEAEKLRMRENLKKSSDDQIRKPDISHLTSSQQHGDRQFFYTVIIQRYIRTWNAKRFAIGLILQKLDMLRERLYEREQEKEEYRMKRLQAAKDRIKMERMRAQQNTFQENTIIEEQLDTNPTTSTPTKRTADTKSDIIDKRRSRSEPYFAQFSMDNRQNNNNNNTWEYSSVDGNSWNKYDEHTQEVIETAYQQGQKEIVLSHGFFAKDQYTITFKGGQIVQRNNKNGTLRNVRRGGRKTFRTVLKRQTHPNLFKDNRNRVNNANLRAVKKMQRKASITLSTIEDVHSENYSVYYGAEPYQLPPEAVIFSEAGSVSPDRRSPSPRERTPLLANSRERINGLISTTRPELHEGVERSKTTRRRFLERTPDKSSTLNHEKSSEFTKESKFSTVSRFGTSGASKLKIPFRNVSRLWGSQRVQNKSKSVKKSNRLANLFSEAPVTGTDFNNNETTTGSSDTAKVPRRLKGRSRSVPNLEALMAEYGEIPNLHSRNNAGPGTTHAGFGARPRLSPAVGDYFRQNTTKT